MLPVAACLDSHGSLSQTSVAWAEHGVGLRDPGDIPNLRDRLCDCPGILQRLPRSRCSSTAYRARRVIGIELRRASEESPRVMGLRLRSGADTAVGTGGPGKADHECLRCRRSCRQHRRPRARSARRERTAPRIPTLNRRLPRSIAAPTDIRLPNPFPLSSQTPQIPPAATSRIRSRIGFSVKPVMAARSTIASVGPSTAAAIRSGSDIRDAAEVAHHP